MNEDMPWVNLTQEEVDQLRKQKHELTEYGKQKIQQLMNNQEPYPDAMFEEAERREREVQQNIKDVIELDKLLTEKEREVLEIAKQAIENNAPAFKRLAEIEKNELIDKAIEELGWIVAGGQDGEEFYNSILFIKKVLERCKQ